MIYQKNIDKKMKVIAMMIMIIPNDRTIHNESNI